MSNKKFSIIIPSYNSNELLTRALLSLKDIDTNMSEIIIIDDGSKINQKKFIPKEIKKYIFIKQGNAGLSVARKNAIEKATGDFIIFIDSDDYIIYEEFKKLENLIININDDIDLIRVGIIKKEYKQKEDYKLSIKHTEVFNNLNKYLWTIFFKEKFTTITSVTHIYNRKKILKHNFINKRMYSEDLEHFARITKYINKIITTNICYYYHDNRRKNSITNSKTNEMYLDQRLIYENVVTNANNRYLKFIFSIFYYFHFKKHNNTKIKGYAKILLLDGIYCLFWRGNSK